ncbi:hypothetical protein ABPG75_006769 [Micractinium tetrahymenae]
MPVPPPTIPRPRGMLGSRDEAGGASGGHDGGVDGHSYQRGGAQAGKSPAARRPPGRAEGGQHNEWRQQVELSLNSHAPASPAGGVKFSRGTCVALLVARTEQWLVLQPASSRPATHQLWPRQLDGR